MNSLSHLRYPTFTALAVLAVSCASLIRLYFYLDIEILGVLDEGMAQLGNVSSDAMLLTGLTTSTHDNETLRYKNSQLHQLRNTTILTNYTLGNQTDLVQVESLNLPERKRFAATQPSPACRPNLNLALPGWKWDNVTKFERIYFYHARKA